MATKNSSAPPSSSLTRTCLCSPTNHPGSFRCSLHRNFGRGSRKPAAAVAATPRVINRVESKAVASIMMTTSSKTRLIKAFLKQIINPSSHDLQRRNNFQPKPTRFCPLNSSANGVEVS